MSCHSTEGHNDKLLASRPCFPWVTGKLTPHSSVMGVVGFQGAYAAQHRENPAYFPMRPSHDFSRNCQDPLFLFF